jgi:hypothetical protein
MPTFDVCAGQAAGLVTWQGGDGHRDP